MSIVKQIKALETLLSFTTSIARGDLSVLEDSEVGLCANIESMYCDYNINKTKWAHSYFSFPSRYIKSLFKTWSGYSDNPTYPIKSKHPSDTAEQSYDTEPHYTGYQLTERQNLCVHMSNSIIKELRVLKGGVVELEELEEPKEQKVPVFNIGDKVVIKAHISPRKGLGGVTRLTEVGVITKVVQSRITSLPSHSYTIKFPTHPCWGGYGDEISLVPVIPEKPVKVGKTRVPATSHKQYDKAFKMAAVRARNNLRATGKRGDLTVLYKALAVTAKHVDYWTKQFDQGHFSEERAVAFSRKEVMIHG